MAAIDWRKLQVTLKAEIARLRRNDLLSVQPVPYARRPNVVIRFPDFWWWLYDFAQDSARLLEKNVKALPQVIATYESRKRDYESEVKDVLDLIHDRMTGRAVCQEIAAVSGSQVRIEPYKRVEACDHNATTRSAFLYSTAVGMPILDTYGRNPTGSGMGTGSDAKVGFTPGHWTRRGNDVGTGVFQSVKCAPPPGPGHQPDEVLFHELVHACRDLRGVSYNLPVNAGYRNEEEFLAVVIGNVYLSEKGQRKLRANHDSDGVLKDPERFLEHAWVSPDPRTLIHRFMLRQYSLFASLARIDVAFNPVRQYDLEEKALRQHFGSLARLRA